MKLRHTIYNSIGLGLAALFGVMVLLNVIRMMRINAVPSHHLFGYLWELAAQTGVAIFTGGGAIANLTSGRLRTKPTVAMIIPYCLTIFLLPLGIWGIIEVAVLPKRPRKVPEPASRSGSKRPSGHSAAFLRRAATISWASSAGGFVIAVLCGATHVRPLINIAVIILFFTLVLSIVLGSVALWGVKEHGSKGILIPALFGICISGCFILMFCAALIVGFSEGAHELLQHNNAVYNSSFSKTNAVSNLH